VERLHDLLDQLDERTVETPGPASFAMSLDTLSAAPSENGGPGLHEEAPVDADSAPADTGDAFLQQIERALTESPAAGAERWSSAEAEEAVDTSPKPGLKCSECGY